MKSDPTAPNRQKHTLLKYLPQGALILASAVALWQNHRTRRCVKEIRPPDKVPLPTPAPHVSIILPVRNEAANIDACLASLTAQDYPDFTITVIDDGSTDATPQHLSAWSKRDPRVQVHRIDQLPAGWAGKAHALHTGVLLTRGEWLLFTDADTCHEPQTLRLMVGHALCQQDDLLSMSLNLMTLSGPATPFLMPVTEILLAQRVTPAEIKDPASPHAFAFGQYILLSREAYLSTGGYGAPGMRTTAIEDLALAEYIKQSGGRVEVVNGRGLVKNCQWTTWNSTRPGWGKGCYSEIIRSDLPFASLPAALAFIAYGLGPLGTLFYALVTGKARRFSVFLASLALLAQVDAKHHFDEKYGLARSWALTAPLAWVVCGVMTLDVARLILTGQRSSWKGRQIPKQERAVRSGTLEHARRSVPALAMLNDLQELDEDGSLFESQGIKLEPEAISAAL